MQEIINNPTGIIELIFKILFIIIALLYLFFAFIIIRQISVMKKTLITSFSPTIQLIGYLHFALAFGVFILYFWIL